jgi:hypothetical protein
VVGRSPWPKLKYKIRHDMLNFFFCYPLVCSSDRRQNRGLPIFHDFPCVAAVQSRYTAPRHLPVPVAEKNHFCISASTCVPNWEMIFGSLGSKCDGRSLEASRLLNRDIQDRLLLSTTTPPCYPRLRRAATKMPRSVCLSPGASSQEVSFGTKKSAISLP